MTKTCLLSSFEVDLKLVLRVSLNSDNSGAVKRIKFNVCTIVEMNSRLNGSPVVGEGTSGEEMVYPEF